MESSVAAFTPEQYAVAYAATRRRIRDLLGDLSDGDADRIVPACPDWTVNDLCAHLAGVAADLAGRRWPGEDVQAWVDGQVAARRGRSVASLLDEWDEAGPAFEAGIVARPAAFAGLLYDIVAHEHDLRHTLGHPGARDTDGVRGSVFLELGILERDLATQGFAAVEILADGQRYVAGSGDIGLRLDLNDHPHGAFELIRVLGSRRSLSQLAGYRWEGDWQAFLPALAHLPLPEADIVE
jgi:uncharacterized protein (TIGR03083 family)